jgi:hypothetical protein
MMNVENNVMVRAVIAILALADGIIHLSLDFILFRGNLIGPLLPPPGAPARTGPPRVNPLILPLNQLFVLNLIGAVVLVVLFWFSDRWLGSRRWLMNVALMIYEAAALFAWLDIGRPNPMGLGYLSKGIEIVAIITLVAYTWGIFRQRAPVAARQTSS